MSAAPAPLDALTGKALKRILKTADWCPQGFVPVYWKKYGEVWFASRREVAKDPANYDRTGCVVLDNGRLSAIRLALTT